MRCEICDRKGISRFKGSYEISICDIDMRCEIERVLVLVKGDMRYRYEMCDRKYSLENKS